MMARFRRLLAQVNRDHVEDVLGVICLFVMLYEGLLFGHALGLK